MGALNNSQRTALAFTVVGLLLLLIGSGQSWSVALGIFNLCLISAVMALGVNIQWGYAGLLNVGVMGFAALGGVSAVLVSRAPVAEAWAAGWGNLLVALLMLLATIFAAVFCYRKFPAGRQRTLAMTFVLVIGFFAIRYFFDPAVSAIEAVGIYP